MDCDVLALDHRNYEVLVGLEEEFLIIHQNGTLVKAADELMKQAANILEDNKRLDIVRLKIRALDAEPNPAQIEYVTLPLPPQELRAAIVAGRELLTDAAKKLNVKILAQSMHPIQSDPHPMCGTHINVSVRRRGNLMSVEDMAAVYNYLWNYLPELWALSANSRYYLGNLTEVFSNRYLRSGVLKSNESARIIVPRKAKAALIPLHDYYGQDRVSLRIASEQDERQVITNRTGNRLVDITPRGPYTNIDQDKEQSPILNRIEIRIFDVQQKVGNLLNLANLCCASALGAVSSKIAINLDPHHKENIQRAVLMGRRGSLIKNGREVPTSQSIAEWNSKTSKFQHILGVNVNPQLLAEESIFLQKNLPVSFETKPIEILRQQGKKFVFVQFYNSVNVVDQRGQKYNIRPKSKVQGILGVQYKLDYKEQIPNMVTHFERIHVINILDLQGLKIPLTKKDKIITALNEEEVINQRILGN
jgi:gamma-glutamyl:cysteine ligase YbdK (ATP-grasp superfamily)